MVLKGRVRSFFEKYLQVENFVDVLRVKEVSLGNWELRVVCGESGQDILSQIFERIGVFWFREGDFEACFKFCLEIVIIDFGFIRGRCYSMWRLGCYLFSKIY